MRSRYTVDEIIEWIGICKDAKKKILSGRVANYSLGSRSVTYLTLDQVNKELAEWEDKLEEVTARGSSRMKRAVIIG